MARIWTKPLQWQNEGIEPSAELKQAGFIGGYRPPADVFNYFLHRQTVCIEELQGAVDEMEGAISGLVVEWQLVIPSSGWAMGAEGMYYVDIPQEDITEEMVPMVSVLPEDLAVAVACGLYPVSQTISGGLRLYAAAAPASAIQASLVLFLAGNGEAGGGSTGGGTYVLPVATATRLGGVKIGENVNVTQDGTISVLGDALLEDVAASDEDVQEMLDEAFNGSDPGANN